MNILVKKPIRRSDFRRQLGRIYYSWRRLLSWYFSPVAFARKKSAPLPFTIFTHKSILLRQLKNVDMSLQHNKINNLRLAAARVDRIVLSPGETFSFWYLVGRPSRLKGYLPGMVLQDGRVKTGIGGGLCQLSNLIFWMTLHTPLDIIERHRHSYDVFPDSSRTLPFGSGATVAYNYIDLQIKNNTAQDFQLSIELDDNYLYGMWRSETTTNFSYEIIEKDHLIQSEFWGGFTRRNKLYRKTIDRMSEKTVNEELLYENYAVMMYNPLLEKKPEIE